MDQSVMTFAGSAARSSAIGTANFEEGMTSYLKDTDKLESYDGTNWVAIGPATSTSGLTLINTTSFSGVSSVSLAADTFTSTYENYYLIVQFDDFTADSSCFLRLRKAGVDATGANYSFASRGLTSTATSFDTNLNANAAGFFLQDTDATGYTPTYSMIKLLGPKVSQYTGVLSEFAASTTAGVPNFQTGGGVHAITDSYDSATIYVSGGNMTGKIVLYGWNK